MLMDGCEHSSLCYLCAEQLRKIILLLRSPTWCRRGFRVVCASHMRFLSVETQLIFQLAHPLLLHPPAMAIIVEVCVDSLDSALASVIDIDFTALSKTYCVAYARAELLGEVPIGSKSAAT